MLAVNLLAEYGILQVSIPPFFGLATILGGFVYGLGMVLSLGCAGAIFYRAGEGKLDYAFVIAAYGISAWAADNWLVQPLRTLTGDGARLTLHTALTVDRWLVIAMVGLGVILWLLRGRQHIGTDRWNWALTGIALGITGIAAWVTSSLTGHASGLGTIQGSTNLTALILEHDFAGINWNLFVVVSIPIGSFIASWRHGASEGKPFRSERIPQALAGGTLLGLGATLSAGDNVLHGLSGVPLLALGSIVFMFVAFLGAWLGIRLGLLD